MNAGIQPTLALVREMFWRGFLIGLISGVMIVLILQIIAEKFEQNAKESKMEDLTPPAAGNELKRNSG